MVYYLGKDVKVYITTETNVAAIKVDGTELKVDSGGGSGNYFANKLLAASIDDSIANTNVSDLTGVDVGIGVTDEDITYMGGQKVLKAEIKKETTVSLTRKKSDAEWDTVFLGTVYNTHEYDDGTLTHGARWGLAYRVAGGGAGTSTLISNGLLSPAEHKEASGTDVTFGYRVHVQLKSGGQWLSVPGCCISGHTVSLNADGTTEETLEFMSYVDTKVGATAGDVTVLTADDM
jgi:acyl CoA:acetate/3-ketoacid CoA transferase alpha subunit